MPFFNQARMPGQPSETDIPVVDFNETGQFALQGNAAQFVSRGKSSMPGSDELTDAKIAAAEAHTERLGGKIDVLTATIVTKLDSLKNDVSKSDQYNHDTRLVLIGIYDISNLPSEILTSR